MIEGSRTGTVELAQAVPPPLQGHSGERLVKKPNLPTTAAGRPAKDVALEILNHTRPVAQWSSVNKIRLPFSGTAHYLLPPSEAPYVVAYDDEPSSIIAYSLSCTQYRTRLLELLAAEEEHKLQTAAAAQATKEALDAALSETVPESLPGRNRSQSQSAPGAPTPNGDAPVDGPSNEDANAIVPGAAEGATLRRGSADTAGPSVGMESFDQLLSTPLGENGELRSSDDILEAENDSQSTAELASAATRMEQSAAAVDVEGHVRVVTDDDVFAVGEEYEAPRTQPHGMGARDKLHPHIVVQLEDSRALVTCRIIYASLFHRLREMCLVDPESFVPSMSRCVPWVASGGKSGSHFCKTLDGRYILKQMSRVEVSSLIAFARSYLNYMFESIRENRPTTLARVLGFFKVTVKALSGKTTRATFLVMENIFYQRRLDHVFDLKGSTRSRYVEGAEESGVLMDENFLEFIRDTPLYMRSHGKLVLNAGVHNDTLFLSRHNVMDYSLLVGIDKANRDMVVGIIDYVRLYTWDKRLETLVKSAGILGGAGKSPTVISPEAYMRRFREAIASYFVMVPDKWHGLSVLRPPKLPVLKRSKALEAKGEQQAAEKTDDRAV